MAMSSLFFRRNSIVHIRLFLSRLLYFSKFKIIVGTVCHYLVSADKFFFVPKKQKKKKDF